MEAHILGLSEWQNQPSQAIENASFSFLPLFIKRKAIFEREICFLRDFILTKIETRQGKRFLKVCVKWTVTHEDASVWRGERI